MAVYTEVTRAELARFLKGYDLGELVDYVGIKEGVENSNFRIDTTLGRFILTLYEKRVRVADLPFFLGLMQHLAEHGLPCPLPVCARGGSMLQALAAKPAAIVSFLDGRSAKRITAARCRSLGQALASMHLAGTGFTVERPNALSIEGWHGLAALTAERAQEVAPDLEREIASELRELAARWPSGLPAGVIHADLFPDNVFFEGDRVSGLIDFYFACNDILAYDVGICLNAWCFERDGALNITKARALLEGYNSRRPLGSEEVKALPTLARGSALRFLLTRLYDWLHRVEGALVQAKDPLEYLQKLRFHRGVAGPEAYGLD